MSSKFKNLGRLLLAPMATILISTAPSVFAQTIYVPDGAAASYAWFNITPGSNESQLCFSWATKNLDMTNFGYIPADYLHPDSFTTYALPVPEVQVVKLNWDETVSSFLSHLDMSRIRTFYGATLKAYFTTSAGTSAAGWYQNKVTISGLKNSSTYAFRIGYDSTWSPIGTFQTQDPSSFCFVAVGDPQLGAATSGSLEPPAQIANVLGYDSTGWANTVAMMSQLVPNASFLLSLGDEVDNSSSQAGVDPQYNAYFSPMQLLSLPVATMDGNHDYGLGQYYGYHYNLPNLSTQYGVSQFGNDGDYWYTYGNALFIVINSNTLSATTHDVFIGQAIAANPKAAWRIVSFHHALYSDADHALDVDILFRRSAYPAIFDKYHIDVVFAGHDHTFTRTYQMLGGLPVSKDKMVMGADSSVTVTDPAGTLYMTLNSGSGSKFYPLNPSFIDPETGVITFPVYVAHHWQQNQPTFSRVSIGGNSLSIVTVSTNNPSSPIDNYTIVKSSVQN